MKYPNTVTITIGAGLTGSTATSGSFKITTLTAGTGNVTINLVNGTFQNIAINSATTITLPNSVAGKSFTIMASYTTSNTIVWAGGTSLKWAGILLQHRLQHLEK